MSGSNFRSFFGSLLMLLACAALLATTAMAHTCSTRHELALALLAEPDQPLAMPTATAVANVSAYLDLDDSYSCLKQKALLDELNAVLAETRQHERHTCIVGNDLSGPTIRLLLSAQAYENFSPTQFYFSPEWGADTVPVAIQKLVHCYDDGYDLKRACYNERDTAYEQAVQQRYNHRLQARTQRYAAHTSHYQRLRSNRGMSALRLQSQGLSWQRSS